jgi:calcium-dependent protein kinase
MTNEGCCHEFTDQYTQMFQMMDNDKDGNLTLDELKEGLQINGHPVPEAEIKMLLEAVSV